MDDRAAFESVDPNLGMSRRTLLKRGAIVGGSLVWAAPAVQSFSRAALAQDNGSPCAMCVVHGKLVIGRCDTTQACCDCLENPAAYGGDCDDVCSAFNCTTTSTCP